MGTTADNNTAHSLQWTPHEQLQHTPCTLRSCVYVSTITHSQKSGYIILVGMGVPRLAPKESIDDVLNQFPYTSPHLIFSNLPFPSLVSFICIYRRWLVTSSKDHTCRVWSVRDMACAALLEGHADAVGAVCLSPRPSSYTSRTALAFSGGADKILKRWAVSTLLSSSSGSRMKVMSRHTASHSVRAHDKDINCVSLAPNDQLLATASQDKTVRLWSASDLTPLSTLKGHKRGVWKVCFSPVDRCLASCSSDRTVKLWSMADYSCLHTFEGHTASVLAVRFCNQGQQLLSK
jgi:WD40 repeat protein